MSLVAEADTRTAVNLALTGRRRHLGGMLFRFGLLATLLLALAILLILLVSTLIEAWPVLSTRGWEFVTSDTSSVLEAKPSHGRQKFRRSASQMPSAASAAPNVTQKPHTKTGICGYWISLYVGVISSSVTANRRTRATSHSPSTPAAASAGSGRCQNASTRGAVHRCSFGADYP